MTNMIDEPLEWRREEIHLPKKRGLTAMVKSLAPPRKPTAEAILEQAVANTGLKDFGIDSYREGLDVLLESALRQGRLSRAGNAQLGRSCVMQAANRLRVQQAIKRDPDLLRVAIERPLFIVGLPRSGGALLQRLLARDSANRFIRRWENDFPAPFPQAPPNQDPRQQISGQLGSAVSQTAPRMDTIHEFRADEPAECLGLFASEFASALPSVNFNAPDYTRWLHERDMTPAYQHYKRQLQLMAFGDKVKGRWVLKAPMHLRYVDALRKAFPDACFVQVHREPERAVASMCSFASLRRSLRSNKIDPKELGAQWTEWLATLAERGAAARDRSGDAVWIDVGFRDVVERPAETIAALYEQLGWPLEDAFAELLAAQVDVERKGNHSAHRYSLSQFGLTREGVRERFADYCRRFEAQAIANS